jgi:Tfp pilus assembly protein PilV
LVEVLVAMVVTVVCVLGVALLILYGTRLGSASREAAVATALNHRRFYPRRTKP